MEGNDERNSMSEVLSDSMIHLSDSSINGRENGELDHNFYIDNVSKNVEFICLGHKATSAPGMEVAPGMVIKDGIKMSREEWLELARRFHIAVSSHSWLSVESLIPCRDQQWLNDALCVTLYSVWFICTCSDVEDVTRLIKRQLIAFKRFLEMVGDQLIGKTFSDAFDVACYHPLILFSGAIESCWASGVAS
ncbi:hypothetical protein EJ110_NYTH45270 [Nymphaea thermarum]|nr:hypothetical protein EJ110_NYTH45270 [Nymphaea thermarum]